jgi:hypothetical protein
MSFSDLAVELSSCTKDSPKFTVVEREMKRRLAKDQAKISLPNILVGAGVAGFFAIVGAFVGGYLKTCPSCQQVAPANSVQKMEKSDLSIKPPITNVPMVISPPAEQSPSHPTDVKKDAQKR